MKNDDVRIGVIGCAGRGGMAKHWHKPGEGSVVVGATDVSDSALDWFKKNVNADGFTTKNRSELVERNDIDAIAVMSPDWTHEEYVLEAFSAGKHVFSEKPMAITTEGCDNMLRAWVKSGKQFMIGFNMRYMRIFRAMKDAIDSGAIGEIKTAWVRHFVGPGGDWYYHDWHGTSKNSTSLLLQKASHDIDMIHWLTGRYTKKVSAMGSLSYYGGNRDNNLKCPQCGEKDTCIEYQHWDSNSDNKMDMCVFRKEIDVEDNSIVMMELDGGINATYMQCHFAPDYWRNYTFIGTEGRIENLDDSGKVIVKTRDRSNRWKNFSNWDMDIKPARGGHGGADPVICRDFIDMIRTGKKPVATPLAGRMSVATGCAATESLRDNWRVVNVPAVPDDIADRIF